MNKNTLLTIGKSFVIILILLAVAFLLRAPASELNGLPTDIRGEYIDSSGLPYFSEMDSYYNLRLTQNYIDHGYVGDTIVNGTQMDMHRYAPDGQDVNYELGIVYVTSFFHKIANHFGSYSVKEVAFWTGAIVSCFAVIPAYIFGRRLSNDYGAIVAAVIVGLAPNYFAHTFPGFFDTDMFYYTFALFFILFFTECIRSNKIINKIIFAILSLISIGLFSISWTGYIFYLAVAALFVVIYLILTYLFKMGTHDIEKYPNRLTWLVHQKDFLTIVGFVLAGVIVLTIFKGLNAIPDLFGRVFSLFSLQASTRSGLAFPNVLISVAEMQKPSLMNLGIDSALLANPGGVVNGIGGMGVLFAGLFSLYLLVSRLWRLKNADVKIDNSVKPHKSKRKSSAAKIDEKYKLNFSKNAFKEFDSIDEIIKTKKLTVLYASLFIAWVIGACLAVYQGSRFITTIVLPFALLTGMFVGNLSEYIKNKLNNDNILFAIVVLGSILASYPLMTINRMFGIILLVVILAVEGVLIFGLQDINISFRNIPLKKYVAVFVVVLALISPTICSAYQTSYSVVPGTSDPMWNSMEWIDENMPEDTVITSWWDFGYLFEIAADRQVTFDGGSQTGERAFWLGQAMTTDNLELSAAIFKMLGTTGDRSVETLNNYTDGDSGLTTKILCEILPMTSDNATNTLMNSYNLTQAQADKIVSLTHPDNPRPVIFVASSDMLQKAGWWSYFGNWNFYTQNSTPYTYYLAQQGVTVEPGKVAKSPIIADSSTIFNVVIDRTAKNNTTGYTEALFANNNSKILINGTEYNPFNLSKVIVIEDGYLVKNQSIDNKDSNYTLLLMGNNNVYTPILMNKQLENSMFTKLFLFGGMNQDIFEQVHMESGVSLWKVNFNNTVASN